MLFFKNFFGHIFLKKLFLFFTIVSSSKDSIRVLQNQSQNVFGEEINKNIQISNKDVPFLTFERAKMTVLNSCRDYIFTASFAANRISTVITFFIEIYEFKTVFQEFLLTKDIKTFFVSFVL